MTNPIVDELKEKWSNTLGNSNPGLHAVLRAIDKYAPMVGNKYNRLTVLGIERRKTGKEIRWMFYTQCECGNRQWQQAKHVRSDHSTSCGPSINSCNLGYRLEQRIITGPSCWGWNGAHDKDGYARMSYKQKDYRVSRLIYEKYNGTLSSGDMVCHTCDNPGCVNPKHLFRGNVSVNTLDCKSKNRLSNVEHVGNPDVKVICDMSFGSTGKGLIAGYISETWKPDTVAIAWMPNAGHTYIDANGRKFVHTMLPNAVVSPNLNTILIGPGSMINPSSLLSEMNACADLMKGVKVMIHPNAGVVTQDHVDTESGPMTKIGSTKKGCGAAIIQRVQRDPDNQNIASVALVGTELEKNVVSISEYNSAVILGKRLLVEMAQGYSLSVYHGFYPYCTSRDCTPRQGLADVGVPYSWVTDIIGTLRTFPIRVSNRYDEDGNMVGWSGPCYPDQKEISWGDISQAPEYTTVTKLQRRVFTFSMQQAMEASLQCEPTKIFLNFCNYLSKDEVGELVNGIEKWTGVSVSYLGHGATFNDIEEMREDDV